MEELVAVMQGNQNTGAWWEILMEYGISDRNTSTKDCAQEISEEIKDSIGNWIKEHFRYLLTKYLSTF